MPSAPIDITLTLNGQQHTLNVDPTTPALSVLRDMLGQTGLTAGCSPQGICGCCAALINGKPRLTCTLRAKSLAGKEIVTQNGFTEAEQTAVSQAFCATGATQCGYCTPGIATQAIGLLRANPDPDDTAIDKALNQHVCRCTGWTKIREAIKLTGRMLAQDPTTPPSGLSTPESMAAVLGRRTRIDDMTRPAMLHAAPCFAPHARCTVTAITIPPDVHALTAAELPEGGANMGGVPLLVAVGEQTQCSADIVALAFGDTAAQARSNAEAITVTADPLEVNLLADAGEIIAEHHVEQGTAPTGEAVAHTVSASVSVAASDPAFLEPDAALAVPMHGGAMHLYSHTQHPFAERDQLAAMLGMEEDHLVVEAVACGGAFGGRSHNPAAGWAALAASHTNRPVRVSLLHADSVRLHAGRPAAQLSLTVQADEQGKLLSVDGELLVDGGGRGDIAAAMTHRAALQMSGPYAVPHHDVRARCSRTHNPPAGVSRGLGGLPGTLALERCMDLLAEATDTDPIDIRLKNMAQPAHGSVLSSLSAAYTTAQQAGQAVGLACASQGLGMGGAEEARIVMIPQETGEIRIYSGFLESGQGFEARAIQAAAETSGLNADRFVLISSTAQPVNSGPSMAGVAGWLGLEAVRSAATELAQKGALVGHAFVGVARSEQPTDTFAAQGFAAQLAILNDKGGIEKLVVAVDTGNGTDHVGTEGQIEGAVHMGVGAALSELRTVHPDGMPETQFRKLGVLKARVSPPVETILHPSAGARPIDDPAMLATAPAIAAAIRCRGEDPGDSLPMMLSMPAKAAGVKPPRPPKAPRRR